MSCVVFCYCFFFKQKTAYEMRISDWSSDVCSSDLSPNSPIGATCLVNSCNWSKLPAPCIALVSASTYTSLALVTSGKPRKRRASSGEHSTSTLTFIGPLHGISLPKLTHALHKVHCKSLSEQNREFRRDTWPPTPKSPPHTAQA